VSEPAIARRAFCLALGAGVVSPARAQAARNVRWEDLRPPGDEQDDIRAKTLQMARAAAHGSFEDVPARMADLQVGSSRTVRSLDGLRIRIKGYVVPLDAGAGTMRSFLLVPYFGACIHAPPPPPNQTVYVISDRPVPLASIYRPAEADGIMSVASSASDMGAAAYQLKLRQLKTER
jgi:hypothetical protein